MSNHSDFKLLSQKHILDTPWLKVSANDYQLPDKTILENYYVVEEKNGVTIVALTPDKKVLIVEQFRPPVETMTFDLPGGYIENADNNSLNRAQQELTEETGYTSSNWIDLGFFYPAPHRLHNTQRCYLALDIHQSNEQSLDDTEFVSFKLVTMNELNEMIQNNKFLCAYCITAYFKAKLYLK